MIHSQKRYQTIHDADSAEPDAESDAEPDAESDADSDADSDDSESDAYSTSNCSEADRLEDRIMSSFPCEDEAAVKQLRALLIHI